MDAHLIKQRIDRISYVRSMYGGLLSSRSMATNALNAFWRSTIKSPRAPPVLNVDLKVTKRCNADCFFCYADITKGRSEELSTGEIIELINSFGNRRVAFFITGGEPFLRKDLFEIISAIKAQGSGCGIVTNGTLFSPSRIEQLVDSGIDNLVFSLHGLSATNDRILGLKNSFGKVIQAVGDISEVCSTRGTRPPFMLVNTVITPSLVEEFEDLVKDVEMAGADALRLSHPSYLLPPEEKEHELISRERFGEVVPTNQHVIEGRSFGDGIEEGNHWNPAQTISRLSQRVATLDTRMRILFAPQLSEEEITGWYGNQFATERRCMYVYTSSFVNERGEVYPCQYYPLSMGNITKERFATIWNNKKYGEFRQMVADSLLPGCARCCKLF